MLVYAASRAMVLSSFAPDHCIKPFGIQFGYANVTFMDFYTILSFQKDFILEL